MELAQQTTVIILAGGRGTRIAALAPDTPKPMITVAEQPFLEWIIKRLNREHFTQILLSIGYKADVVIKWLESRATSPAGQNLRYHLEQQPLGTGGAIADALTKVHTEYVLVLNGDTLLLTDFLPAMQKLVQGKLDGVIIARSLEDTGRYGRLNASNGLLKEFQEKMPGAGLINGGIYAFRTDWLKQHIGAGISSIEVDIFPRMLREGAKIGVEVTTAPFIDIGTPESLGEASAFVTTHAEYFR